MAFLWLYPSSSNVGRTQKCHYCGNDYSTEKQEEETIVTSFLGAKVVKIRTIVNYSGSDCGICGLLVFAFLLFAFLSCSFVVTRRFYCWARRFFFGCLLFLLFLLLLPPSPLRFVRAGGFFAFVARWFEDFVRIHDLHDTRRLVLRVELDIGAIHINLSRWGICGVNVRRWREKRLCSRRSIPVWCRWRRRWHHRLLRHSWLH